MINQNVIDFVTELNQDFPLYAKVNLRVLTKDLQLLPLKLNQAQEYVNSIANEQLSKIGKIRLIILKGRQQGISSYVQARFFWKTSMNFNSHAFVMAHQAKSSSIIFEMAKRFYDHSIQELKPSISHSNAKELKFDGMRSGYAVGTAGSAEVGRGMMFPFLHASEVAFWDHGEKIFAGLMQCVPSGQFAKGTEIWIESTANGVGGQFHELWMQAVNGASEYIPVFIPWYWSDEYRNPSHDFVATPDEDRLKRIYKLDDEQLQWRRDKIFEIGADKFKQEYPFTWSEAFLSTGRTVFDKDNMTDALAETWKPKHRMVLEQTIDTSAIKIKWKGIDQYCRFVDREDGELRVWFKPEKGVKYVIGGDTAEGLEHGDYSCADVLEYPGGQQVAQWHGHIAPDLFAKVLFVLGMYYNKALIGNESNNHGILTNTTLRDMYYPNLYVQRSIDDRGSNEKETRRVGWITTSKSKPYIIDLLSAELRDGSHGIACKETVQEMQSFVIHDDGSLGAQSKCYDDRVMSRAIAGEMLRAQNG